MRESATTWYYRCHMAGIPCTGLETVMPERALFDEWTDRYEQWFTTPIGSLVRQVESELITNLLNPARGERLLDAGCGTGVFTTDMLGAGAQVAGLDISAPMLEVARHKTSGLPFFPIQADMRSLPFRDGCFDKTVSITALEFIEDGRKAINELFRVTRPGGVVLIATLNSLSPWAERRRAKTARGQRHILEDAFYRSPEQVLDLSALPGVARTAVHFGKDDDPDEAATIESRGRAEGLDTGAFIAVRWQKPD